MFGRYRRPIGVLCLTAASWIAVAGGAPPYRQMLDVKVAMRDGVKLSTNLFLPTGGGPFPTILIRTPYNKGPVLLPHYEPFLQQGFALVMQDVRGRYASEGKFRSIRQEGPDGSDTIDWIARQSWSNGNVGMMGGSYVGIVQWRAALQRNPHLKAIFPVVAGSDEYRDRFYSPGGALKLGHRLLWLSENLKLPGFMADFGQYTRQLPVRAADRAATGQRAEIWQDVTDHPSYDDFWKAVSTREQLDRVSVPVFLVGGWYDNYVQSDLETFRTLQDRAPVNHIVVGPWPHNMSLKFPGVDFGPDSGAPVRRYQIEWFRQWLKVRPYGPVAFTPDALPPVRLFVMGINQWRDEQEWPLSRARVTPFYLQSKGQANTAAGDGLLTSATAVTPADHFTYDPQHPVPTRGGTVCCNPSVFPWGPTDQRDLEQRRDVLVYTTPVLTRDVEVTGPVKVVLQVSTSAVDTDFTAKLVDVFPDGQARNLTDGILRLRYRRGLDTPMLAEPNRIYQITIDTGVTSNVFRTGHKIRLEVSSSNFPRFDRNPNTGRAVADESKLVTAQQTVYHDREHPSYVLLPVVPAAPVPSPLSNGGKNPRLSSRPLPAGLRGREQSIVKGYVRLDGAVAKR